MAFTHDLYNGMEMQFNGSSTVNRIEGWVLLKQLKKVVVEENNKEFECPLCKTSLSSCECEKILAHEILCELLKKEIDKNIIEKKV